MPTSRRRALALVCGTLAAAPVALTVSTIAATPVAASPTRAEVAYVLYDEEEGSSSIVVRGLEARDGSVVLPDTGEVDGELALSPDGTKIAFATTRGSSTGRIGIAVVNVDGTGFARVTTPPASTDTTDIADGEPAWAPDGSFLYFARSSVDLSSGVLSGTLLRVTPTASAATDPVPGTGNAISPTPSPDGTRLAYVGLALDNEGAGSVLVKQLGTETPASAVGGFGYEPAWSPDGSQIAFVTFDDGGPGGIAVLPAGGGTPADVVAAGASELVFAPEWLPDGRSLAYTTVDLEDFTFDIAAVGLGGAAPGLLFASTGFEAFPTFHAPALANGTPGALSTYVPVTPQRVLDTRIGLGGPAVPVGAGATRTLTVAGRTLTSGTVPQTVTAVVLNVTATQPTATTDVRVYPDGAPVPGTSSLNVRRGQTAPNLVIVPVGPAGDVVLRNQSGSVHLIADIAGYFVGTSDGGRFTATDPVRVLDTRTGLNAAATRLGAGRTTDLLLEGEVDIAGGGTVTVPADVTAVVLNVTATGATRTTDIRVYPTNASSVPDVSNLNVGPGLTAPNLVVVPVAPDGTVRLRNQAGLVHVIADLAGWFRPGSGDVFVPFSPTRLLDTRTGTGAAPLPLGGTGLQVAGARGIDSNASAVVLNVTGVAPSTSTHLTAYPASAGTPTVSTLNLTRGAVRANLAVVKVDGGDNGILLVNNAGTVHVLADAAGYFLTQNA